ncbi:MotA/TolQ/ExbB proton channel family protein [Amaricoccus sp. W119]|uniref:MotA/TolQ/ExbB proton channel family protein n=1 Tax=Amaricoccus sp. W119 TaxID=3391833 RepID=UPI0039A50165
MAEAKESATLAAISSDLTHKSGLSEWRRWCFVLAIAAGVVVVPVLGGPALSSVPIDLVFYVLIVGVAAITIGRSYSDARYLQHETDLATKQVLDLVELDDISSFLEASERSQFRSHIEALYTIFQQDTEISQDNLIELLRERLEARNRLSELFSSILITLGLIGTIAGLIIMVSKLRSSMGDFDPSSGDELIKELMQDGGALSGLDTAFYTTLLGAVLGGVMLRVLTNVVGSNIVRYTAYIAELTEIYVLPSLRNMARQLDENGYYRRQGQ